MMLNSYDRLFNLYRTTIMEFFFFFFFAYGTLPLTFEPTHDKTNKMACGPSEDSGQPWASAQSDQN